MIILKPLLNLSAFVDGVIDLGPGLRHGPPEVIARMSKGEDVDRSSYYFREVMRFETSSPKFDWMTRILALATGARTKEQVKLEVFEVL